MKRIFIGSKAAQKIEAVMAAAASIGLEADVIGVSTVSGVPEQPLGRTQTMQGALNRALAAERADPDAWFLGIENGIEIDGGEYVDCAYVVVLTPSGDGVFLRSEAVPVPSDLVGDVVASRKAVTAGSLEAKRSGCDPADPHRVWSGGKTDRTTILTDVVRRALTLAIAAQGATS